MNKFIAVNPKDCIGCRICQLACDQAHSPQRGKTVGCLQTISPRLHLVETATGRFPIQCRQCEDAPCAKSCQLDAIISVDGAVIVDVSRCIGCKSCLLACPFGAIELNQILHTASKCDLCINSAPEPACVKNCPQQALQIIDPEQYRKMRMQQAARRVTQHPREEI